MTVLKTNHLTAAPIDGAARESFAGMAHFAGTGPQFTKCRHCSHFESEPPPKKKAKPGPPKPATCRKYREITGNTGAKVPAEAASCKYYEAVNVNAAA
jgi:hypothetical protein